MIIEINIIGGSGGQWMDIGVCRHVYYDCAIFKTYINIENKKVMLGDVHNTNVVCIEDMGMKFT